MTHCLLPQRRSWPCKVASVRCTLGPIKPHSHSHAHSRTPNTHTHSLSLSIDIFHNYKLSLNLAWYIHPLLPSIYLSQSCSIRTYPSLSPSFSLHISTYLSTSVDPSLLNKHREQLDVSMSYKRKANQLILCIESSWTKFQVVLR